ncbi:MAG: TRAP transporter small permease [Firmicutes bacterium]|nr:TRAP transporter small permease [Bacillota bacterium]
MQDYLKRIIKVLVRVQTILGVLTLAGIIICNSLGVFFRYVLRDPFTWTEELSVILFIWVVFLGSTVAAGAKRHVVVDVIVNRVSKEHQARIDILTRLISLGFLVVLTYGGFQLIPMMSTHYSVALNVPKSFYYIPVTIFAFSMSLIIIDEIWDIGKTLHV